MWLLGIALKFCLQQQSFLHPRVKCFQGSSKCFLTLLSLFLLDCSLQELQKAVDHRKAVILSINLCSSEFTQADSRESHGLQERISQMNGRWDRVCSLLEDWRGLLQEVLMQCQVGRALGR